MLHGHFKNGVCSRKVLDGVVALTMASLFQAILESVESEYATASGATPVSSRCVGTAWDMGTELFSRKGGEKLKEQN